MVTGASTVGHCVSRTHLEASLEGGAKLEITATTTEQAIR